MAVFTADVSEDGFCAELMHVLTPGSQVNGTLSLGPNEYPFVGKVAWARAGDARLGQRGRMGVHFETIDDRFLAAYQQNFPEK